MQILIGLFINLIPYECTTKTCLLSVQFKNIQRFFFTCNYNLRLWATVDSNKYANCNAIDIDTLNRYFVECESTRML